MIGAAQLAGSRTQMERMLTGSCTHYARTDTVSASGSSARTWAASGTVLPCLVYATKSAGKAGETSVVGGGNAEVATHSIRLKYDSGVRVGDKIVVGTDKFLVVEDGDSDTNRFILQVGAQRIRGNKF